MKSRWDELDSLWYTAVFLALSFVVLDEYLLDFPARQFLIEKSQGSLLDQARVGVYFAFDFGLLFLFIRESLFSRALLKISYGVLFAIAIVTEYSYQRLFGRFISEVDFELVASSRLSLWLSAIDLHFSFYSLIPVSVYFVLLMVIRPQPKRFDSVIFISILGVISLSCLRPPLATVSAEHLFATEATPTLVRFYQTFSRYLVLHSESSLRREVPDFTIRPGDRPNIVILVDESIRADHLSLNGYSRDTTPYLRSLEREGKLRNFGSAIAGATCSPLSNAMLITGTPPSEESYRLVFKRPTIFQFAKEAGYRTTYIDAQTDTLWTGLSSSDLKYIDRWVRGSELGEVVSRDLRAATLIKETVESASVSNFIVLNKRGVHFKYEDSYPVTEELWGPLPPHRDYLRHTELVPNPYDNGIRYSVDGFFRALLDPPLSSSLSTVFVYTSDHGQTLFEGGVSWLHCNNTLIEAEVPLFLVGDPPVIGSLEMEPMHRSIFSTALLLMGVPREVIESSVREKGHESHRCFVTGSLQVVCHK